MMCRAFLFFVILLSCISIAKADPQIEVNGGQCFYNQSGVGEWWQGEGYESKSLRSECWQLGISDTFRERAGFNDGWRIAWVDLGTPALHEVASGGPGPQPHWWADGEGAFYGASLGVFRAWRGRLSPSIEGGIFAYRSQWHASAWHNASGKLNPEFSTPARHSATLYIGAGIAYRLTDSLSWTMNARIYPRLRSNTMEPRGDTVGSKYVDVIVFNTGISFAWK